MPHTITTIELMQLYQVLNNHLVMLEKENRKSVDRTIGEPITKAQATFLTFSESWIDEIRQLRDRLRNMLPRDML